MLNRFSHGLLLQITVFQKRHIILVIHIYVFCAGIEASVVRNLVVLLGVVLPMLSEQSVLWLLLSQQSGGPDEFQGGPREQRWLRNGAQTYRKQQVEKQLVWTDHAENGVECTDSLSGSQPIGAEVRFQQRLVWWVGGEGKNPHVFLILQIINSNPYFNIESL